MARRRELDRFRNPLNKARKSDILNRVKTARGHLDHVIEAVEDDQYIIEILQQLSAVRGSIDATLKVALRYYCEHGFAPAVRGGAVGPAIDELMSALAFHKAP